MYSRTFLGKLICGLCALCGVFILTLPIPIVVSSFAQCYKRKLWRNEIATRRRMASKLVQIIFTILQNVDPILIQTQKDGKIRHTIQSFDLWWFIWCQKDKWSLSKPLVWYTRIWKADQITKQDSNGHKSGQEKTKIESAQVIENHLILDLQLFTSQTHQ